MTYLVPSFPNREFKIKLRLDEYAGSGLSFFARAVYRRVSLRKVLTPFLVVVKDLQRAIFKTGNRESGNGNGEWERGTGNL